MPLESVKGFAVTFRQLFKKPITVNYPEQKVPMFPKWRGKQVLMRDENGLEKCVACGLCSVVCPADAIKRTGDGVVQSARKPRWCLDTTAAAGSSGRTAAPGPAGLLRACPLRICGRRRATVKRCCSRPPCRW